MTSFLRKLIPSYFLDKFDGKDMDQLQLMPPDLYNKVTAGTDEEADIAVRTFIEQQQQSGVIILDATIELLSDIRGQTRITKGKEM